MDKLLDNLNRNLHNAVACCAAIAIFQASALFLDSVGLNFAHYLGTMARASATAIGLINDVEVEQ